MDLDGSVSAKVESNIRLESLYDQVGVITNSMTFRAQIGKDTIREKNFCLQKRTQSLLNNWSLP
jgi:hypothetical protein